MRDGRAMCSHGSPLCYILRPDDRGDDGDLRRWRQSLGTTNMPSKLSSAVAPFCRAAFDLTAASVNNHSTPQTASTGSRESAERKRRGAQNRRPRGVKRGGGSQRTAVEKSKVVGAPSIVHTEVAGLPHSMKSVLPKAGEGRLVDPPRGISNPWIVREITVRYYKRGLLQAWKGQGYSIILSSRVRVRAKSSLYVFHILCTAFSRVNTRSRREERTT